MDTIRGAGTGTQKKNTVNDHSYISAANLPEPGQSSVSSFATIERELRYVTVTYRINNEIVRRAICKTLKRPYAPLEQPQSPLFQGVIRLTYSPRNFGGQQVYFVCPKCESRAIKLYWRFRRFACRTCQELTYESCQHSHENDRGNGLMLALGVLTQQQLWDRKLDKLFEQLKRTQNGSKAQIQLQARIERLFRRMDCLQRLYPSL